MSEYVYKLNLPSIENVLLPDLVEKLLLPSTSGLFDRYETKSIFKEEYVFWKGIFWNDVYHFFKTNGWEGPVHSDVEDNMYNCWGINWVHGGLGIMEYWEPHHAGEPAISTDGYNHNIRYYNPPRISTKKYEMPPGAYLVDTTMPHRAIGWNRHVFSLRCTIHEYQINHPWNKMIDLFHQNIKD